MVAKKKRLPNIAAGIILAAILVMLPIASGATASGLAVAPSRIDINDTLPGGEYDVLITIFNTDSETGVFHLAAEGDVQSWLSFHPWGEQDDKTIDALTIPGGGSVRCLVRATIPNDAPVGISSGQLYVETVLAGTEAAGSPVVFQAKVNVTIGVSGTPHLAGVIRSIKADDIEEGFPFRIRIRFENTGNVVAKPEVDVVVANGGTEIGSFAISQTTIKPARSDDLIAEFDTAGIVPGDYVADIDVLLGTEVIAAEKLSFTILPRGTLTRWGVLSELGAQEAQVLGEVTKVEATFSNTGEIDTKAKFVGEIYRDDRLVEIVTSEEMLVPVAESQVLVCYAELDSAGAYSVRGAVLYEGKRSNAMETSFRIGLPPEPSEPAQAEAASEALGKPGTGFPSMQVGLLAFFVVLVLAGGVLYRRKTQRRTQTRH